MNLQDVNITLYTDPNGDGDPADGVEVASVLTDTDGNYTFTGLTPGDYVAVETQPAGLDDVKEDEGGADDDQPDNHITNAIAGTVDAGENDANNDFVEEEPASLGDRVWYDTNRDGIQDPGEGNVSDVMVYLLDENGNRVQDSNGDDINTTTDANGEYLFEGLTPGIYSVEFDLGTLPNAYIATLQDQGSDETKESDADINTGKTASVALSAGEHYKDLDLGVVPIGSLSGNVSHENREGIYPMAGVTLILYDENGNEVARTTTDENGNYHFGGLVPGNYTIREQQPDGYFDVRENEGGSDDDNTTATGTNEISATVGIGENDSENDFVEAQPASLGDYVWLDSNEDGIQDDNETGVPDVTVYLLDENGDRIQVNGVDVSTETNSTGGYLFDGLDPLKAYAVEFDLTTLPSGYRATLEGEGTEEKDSDVDPDTGKTEPVQMYAGEHYPHIDLGIKPSLYHIGTHFWIDENGNNQYDGSSTDTPIPDALVELLDEDGSKLYWTDETNTSVTTEETAFPVETQTTEDGEYGFDVPAGSYQVRFHIPPELETEGYGFTGNNGNNHDDNANIDNANKNGITQTVEVGPGHKTADLTLDAAVSCLCANAPIQSNGGSALGVVGLLLMMLMTLGSGLLFVRREERREI